MGEEAAPPPEVRLNVRHDEDPSNGKTRLWRVPEQVRAINKEAYEPKFVCIGPYHRRRDDGGDGGGGGKRLRGEKLKERYLKGLLSDVESDPNKHGDILEQCRRSLLEMVDDVRGFYAEEYVRDMKDEDMVTMLLDDGCFIIKHLYNYAQGYNEEELYATRWAPVQLRIDLGLLENQIPFSVLVELFHHLTPRGILRKITAGVGIDDDQTMPQRSWRTLQDMALWYMLAGWYDLPADRSPTRHLRIAADVPVHHLLHLLHLAHLVKVDAAVAEKAHEPWPQLHVCLCRVLQFLLCVLPVWLIGFLLRMCRWRGGAGGVNRLDPKANIASAAKLRGLGVKIRMVPRERGGILDVRLRKGLVTPELEVPALSVEQPTALLLQNLVAYEQQGTPATGKDEPKPKDYFTTYAFLMYNLVSTTEDITVLQEQGVLLNNFGSHETIIDYFKNLCRWNQRSGTEETPIGKVLQELRDCSQNRAYRDWAEAKKYMDSPVKILALIVSTLLAISTVMQATTAFVNPKMIDRAHLNSTPKRKIGYFRS